MACLQAVLLLRKGLSFHDNTTCPVGAPSEQGVGLSINHSKVGAALLALALALLFAAYRAAAGLLVGLSMLVGDAVEPNSTAAAAAAAMLCNASR